MRDLEIRGAGSILGEMQHGHMDEVGYDMYCKLLDEVVKEMKGISIKEEQDVQIDLNVSSYIPENYIEDANQKIEVYQNIALCRTEEDIQNITDELIDRYGQMPDELEGLLEVARIKNLARTLGITKIAQKQQSVVLNFGREAFKTEWVDVLLKEFRNQIKFSPGKDPYVTYKLQNNSKVLQEINNVLEALNNN